MIIVGLTGSIGMGKSTVSQMFRQLGIPVFDADAAVHELQGPNGLLLPEIEKHFPGTTTAQGVDRQKLAALVLREPAALAKLEALVHPRVADMRRAFLRRYRARRMVVLDVPLLFEKKGWRSVDLVVVVSAPRWMQRRRVLARKSMSGRRFQDILNLQTPDHVKRRAADVVIETGRQRNETRAAVRRLISCINDRHTQYSSNA
jgi:dephospho-CoA kinase